MTNRLLRIPISLLGVLQLLTYTSFVSAQTPMEKLRVAYTVIAPTQLNVWTAKELGYYTSMGSTLSWFFWSGPHSPLPLWLAEKPRSSTPERPR